MANLNESFSVELKMICFFKHLCPFLFSSFLFLKSFFCFLNSFFENFKLFSFFYFLFFENLICFFFLNFILFFVFKLLPLKTFIHFVLFFFFTWKLHYIFIFDFYLTIVSLSYLEKVIVKDWDLFQIIHDSHQQWKNNGTPFYSLVHVCQSIEHYRFPYQHKLPIGQKFW